MFHKVSKCAAKPQLSLSLSRIFAADYLLPRSDKTPVRMGFTHCTHRIYARDFLLLRIKDFNCFLLCDPVNFNCFLSHFDWVNTQIPSLIRVLSRVTRNSVFRVSSQVRHKLGCNTTEDIYRFEILDSLRRGIQLLM